MSLMPAYIAFLALQPFVDLIVSSRVTHGPGDDMTVDMRHTLPRCLTILHRDVEGIGFIQALESSLNPSHCEEKIGDLVFGEIG